MAEATASPPAHSEVQQTIRDIDAISHNDAGAELFVLCTNFLLYVALVILTMLLQRMYFPDSLLSEDTDNTSDGKLIDVEEGDNEEEEEEEDIGTKAFNEEAGTLPSASSSPAAIPEALLVNSSESSASAPFLGTAERSSLGTGKGAIQLDKTKRNEK